MGVLQKSHNQGVLGSSPSGTTTQNQAVTTPVATAFLFPEHKPSAAGGNVRPIFQTNFRDRMISYQR